MDNLYLIMRSRYQGLANLRVRSIYYLIGGLTNGQIS